MTPMERFDRDMAEAAQIEAEGYVALPREVEGRVRGDLPAYEAAIRRQQGRLFLRKDIAALVGHVPDVLVWKAVQHPAFAADLTRCLPVLGRVPHEDFVRAVEDPGFCETLKAGLRAIDVLQSTSQEAKPQKSHTAEMKAGIQSYLQPQQPLDVERKLFLGIDWATAQEPDAP